MAFGKVCVPSEISARWRGSSVKQGALGGAQDAANPQPFNHGLTGPSTRTSREPTLLAPSDWRSAPLALARALAAGTTASSVALPSPEVAVQRAPSVTDGDPDGVNPRPAGSPVSAPAALSAGSRCAVRLRRAHRG